MTRKRLEQTASDTDGHHHAKDNVATNAAEFATGAGPDLGAGHVAAGLQSNTAAGNNLDFSLLPVPPPNLQPWSCGDVDMMGGDFSGGFWMGDVSDDLDWDGIMDLDAL